ncbi:TPA: cupin domain-containing protein, partial [Pseudomonas aeruginosa]
YIVSGEGRFTPDEGQAVEFRAGDALYFAAATQGTWDIRQTVRKTYLIFD